MLDHEAALVILSGGQDSTTCLFWALQRFKRVEAVTFDYGQRHAREIEAACKVAEMAGIGAYHRIVTLGPILLGASPLTDHSRPLEQYPDFATMDRIIGDRVELTFVPMRNALFLTLAANHAVARGLGALVTGVCQADNANYPDCRQSFIDSFAHMAREALGLKPPGLILHTPLMDLTKAMSIKLAQRLPGCMEALAYSHTAYDGSYPPTGSDHATVLRAHGFEEAGVPDPLILRAFHEGLIPALPPTANYDSSALRRPQPAA